MEQIVFRIIGVTYINLDKSNTSGSRPPLEEVMAHALGIDPDAVGEDWVVLQGSGTKQQMETKLNELGAWVLFRRKANPETSGLFYYGYLYLQLPDASGWVLDRVYLYDKSVELLYTRGLLS